MLVAFFVQRKAIGDAHLTEPGIAAETRADTWMHEHGPRRRAGGRRGRRGGAARPELIRRVREEGYANEGA